MRNRKIIYMTLIFLISFFGFSSVYATELDPSDVLGEIPGYFEFDDEDIVCHGIKYFPTGYTLGELINQEDLSSLKYLIPISNNLEVSRIGFCRNSSCVQYHYYNDPNSSIYDSEYDVYEIEYNHTIRYSANSSSTVLSTLSNYYHYGPNNIRVEFINGDYTIFKFQTKKDYNSYGDVLNTDISNYYDDGYYSNDDPLYILSDNKLLIKFPSDIEMVDDSFDLSMINDLVGKSYVYSYIYDQYGDVVDDISYDINGDTLTIVYPGVMYLGGNSISNAG